MGGTTPDSTGKKFEPTWGQGMHAEPKGDEGQYAVQCNWYEAEAYCRWLGAQKGHVVRLPAEEEWEPS